MLNITLRKGMLEVLIPRLLHMPPLEYLNLAKRFLLHQLDIGEV
jgi:hypothetical protein